MRFIGIDPGKSGVCVILNDDPNRLEVEAHKLKFDKQGQLELDTIKWIRERVCRSDMILLEKPGVGGTSWGSTQIFNFGHVCGQVNLAARLVGCRVRLVTPQQWQKPIHTGLDKKLKAKERTFLAYEQMFHREALVRPRCKAPDKDAVDALMIAVYGVLEYGGGKLNAWEFNEVWKTES